MESAQEKRDRLVTAHWFEENIFTDQKDDVEAASIELLNHIHSIYKPQRKHISRHLPQVEVFLLNVLLAYKYTDGVMSVNKSAGWYSNKIITYRITVDLIISSLIKSEWLIEYPGFFGGITGSLTRLELTNEFCSWLDSHNLDVPKTKVKKPSKCIVLKDENKRVIDTPKHLKKEEELLALNVSAINQFLENNHIGLAVSNAELSIINSQMKDKSINDSTRESYLFFSKKYLQRKFNNSRFDNGGRFYGGWWITIPKEWRKYITINGYPTVELDYSGMHLQMLYAKEGAEITGDPYAIEGVCKNFRDVTKLIFVILFNASSRNTALATIKNNPKIKILRNNKYPKGIRNFDEYLKLIEKNYSIISNYFYTGYGVNLQFHDSTIIEKVMLRMIKEYDAVTLPIHDSLITQYQYGSELKSCMEDEFKVLTGGSCKVSLKNTAE
jgi:hypothetical protein